MALARPAEKLMSKSVSVALTDTVLVWPAGA
jgi:hypothetical protein